MSSDLWQDVEDEKIKDKESNRPVNDFFALSWIELWKLHGSLAAVTDTGAELSA